MPTIGKIHRADFFATSRTVLRELCFLWTPLRGTAQGVRDSQKRDRRRLSPLAVPTSSRRHASCQNTDAAEPLDEKTQGADFETLKRRIHSKLVDKLDLTRVGELEGDVLRREIRLVVEHLCDTEDTLLNRSERERLIEEVLDETFGLGPLELLLKDQTISDILINGPKNIYVERRGKMEKTDRRSSATTPT